MPVHNQNIASALQRAMAAQINARVKSIVSSHVVMLSHAQEVADTILDAVANLGAHT
jgi:hypothetical protein